MSTLVLEEGPFEPRLTTAMTNPSKGREVRRQQCSRLHEWPQTPARNPRSSRSPEAAFLGVTHSVVDIFGRYYHCYTVFCRYRRRTRWSFRATTPPRGGECSGKAKTPRPRTGRVHGALVLATPHVGLWTVRR